MSGDTIECPNCHTVYTAIPHMRGGASAGWGGAYQQRTMQRRDFNLFGKDKSKDVEQAERRVPLSHARPSFESSFKTPLSISLATGSFFLLGGLLLGFELKLVLGAGLIVSFATWYWQIKGDRSLLSVVETLTNRDWDGDGNIGEEEDGDEPRSDNLSLELQESPVNNTTRLSYMNFPVSQVNMIKIARATVLDKEPKPLTEREWTGKGKPFATRSHFNAFRKCLIDREYGEWKSTDTRSGWRLTKRGGDLFYSLAQQHSPTLDR